MKELLSKKDQRHLSLIEELYHENQWQTYSAIAKKLNCSIRILKDDILELKKEQSDFELETSYEGVFLHFKPHKGMQSVYQHYLLHSKAFDLFQKIFTDESFSSEKLAKSLFISTSTLRRLVKKAKGYLEEYFGLSIHSNPYYYVGKEENIRYFCYQLYTETYSGSDRTIGEWHSSELDTFLNTFYKALDLTIPYPTLHELKMVIGVNAVRYKQGHLVKNLNPTMQSEEDLKKAFSVLDSIPNPFSFELDRESILQLFFPFSTYWYLKSEKHLEESLKIDKHLRTSHNYLSSWLTQLSVEHQVPLPNMRELLLDLHNLNYFYADPLHTQSFLVSDE